MPNPLAAPTDLHNPDAALAYNIATLAVRLGLVVLGAVIVIRVGGSLINRLERAIRARGQGDESAREKRAKTLGSVLRGLTRSATVVVAALMGVRELGLDITPAVAAAGGFGVAAGLGAQSVVRDWLGGFFIIHDNQYVVGDAIRVSGVAGTVEGLTLRHTEVRDGDGSLHYIANGEIKVVTNLTKSWSAPTVRIPVSLTQDPTRATVILQAFLLEFERIPSMAPLLLEPPKLLGVDDISAGQFTMLLQARTPPEHRFTVSRALRLGAIERLRAEGIELHAPGAQA